MGRPTRQKLARELARRLESDERNRQMRTNHEDKSIHTATTKIDPRLQHAYDLRTAQLVADAALSADERSAVGKAVALAAEQASLSPIWRALSERRKAAAAPNAAEQAEIDRALAAWQAAFDTTFKARTLLRVAVEEAQAAHRWATGEAYDAREYARLRAEVAAAGQVLQRAERDELIRSEDLGRVRGEAVVAGRQRVYALVEAGI